MFTVMKTFVLDTMLAGVLFLFICSFASVQGEIYKWTDPQGRLHFSNAPTGNAEAVDDALPPASSFAAPPEPTPVPTASSIPSSDADSPPQPTAQVPAEESEPLVEDPTTGSDAVPLPEESPPPSASADVPGISDSADLSDVPGIGDTTVLSQEEPTTDE